MTKENKLSGVLTALITPFWQGEVDYVSLKRLLRQQLDGGVEGFVVNGTTGESPTLRPEEVKEIFSFVTSEVAGAVPILVGTGTNNTQTTIELTQKVAKWGAFGAMVVTPYYNKPPQRGMIAHFRSLAEAVPDLPVVLYNVPGRTGVTLKIETVAELSRLPNIVGIKEASGRIEDVSRLRELTGADFALLSGDDGSYPEFLAAGGNGVISVVSHLIPEEMVTATRGMFSEGALRSTAADRIKKINEVLAIDVNPIPVKESLCQIGLIRSSEVRLPLVPLEESSRTELCRNMAAMELI